MKEYQLGIIYEQGGSGNKIFKVNSYPELMEIFSTIPNIWEPDNLFLLQDEIEYSKEYGIIRIEFIGDEILYAMRVVTNGSFNLCPSTVCNPESGESQSCNIPQTTPPKFYPAKDIPQKVIDETIFIKKSTGHQIASIEFAFDNQGTAVYYDINSNSNLRKSICEEYGNGDPFIRVVDYLESYTRT